MRNDVLQIYLVQFLKYLADNFTLLNHYIQMDFWLYTMGVQFNFYQNITEIYILFYNKVLGMEIHVI